MLLDSEQITTQIQKDSSFIQPFLKSQLKPVSYTFRVGDHYFDEGKLANIPEHGLSLIPGQFLVLESLEQIHFPKDIAGILSTRGSMAKKGLDALLTDTVIEPGSTGKLTFCCKNNSSQKVVIKPGDSLVKCLFMKIG